MYLDTLFSGGRGLHDATPSGLLAVATGDGRPLAQPDVHVDNEPGINDKTDSDPLHDRGLEVMQDILAEPQNRDR